MILSFYFDHLKHFIKFINNSKSFSFKIFNSKPFYILQHTLFFLSKNLILFSKKINNSKKIHIKRDNQELIKLIKEGLTTAELIEKGYNWSRINRRQLKIKNGYEEEYRKIRTPKPKIDNALVQNFLNFDINNIENENDKISLIIA